MRTITPALQAHLDSGVTSLATCWKVIRRDGAELGFTDYSHAIELDGITYQPESGMVPSAVSNDDSLAVDQLDVEGVLDSSHISEADILAGRYDGAEIRIFMVNAQAPEEGVIQLRRGVMGEVQLRDGRFVAEIRGMMQPLSQTIGELYSAACRTSFGSGQCGINRANYQHSATVQTVESELAITFSGGLPGDANYFAYGVIQFTSGANAGLSMEIKHSKDALITLTLPMPYPVDVADEAVLTAGCNKRFSTCVARFNNAVNFRGEPHVPGLDRVLQTATTRSEW